MPDLVPLPLRVRADIFSQLLAMENAGLPFDRALSLLQQTAPDRVRQTGRLYARGINLADAGASSGLFTPIEASLVRAALRGGSPAPTYRRLAERYTRRAAQLAQLKSKLLLPGFMLLAAFLIQPLPALVLGSVSLAAYLAAAIIKIGVVITLAFLLSRLPAWLEKNQTAASLQVDAFMAALPVVGEIYLRRSAATFFEHLALLVEAGMPILDALPEAESTVISARLRRQFGRVKPALQQGATLAQAVGKLVIPGRNTAQQFIRTGEESGALPEMLLRHADSETDAIEHRIAIIMQWLPRLIYAAVAVWIALGILQGGVPGSLEVLRKNDL